METKNVPTIIMLAAGFVTSVVMYINRYDLITTLKTVLVVFFAFYLFGVLIKKLLDAFCPLPKEEEEKDEEEGEGNEEEQKGNEDGSVIEKK